MTRYDKWSEETFSGPGNKSVRASHVGQIFFDQRLINTIERFPPYRDNTIPNTTNVEDDLLVQQASKMDPIVNYFWRDTAVAEDGIVAWITIAIDPLNEIEVPIAERGDPDGDREDETSGSEISITAVTSATVSNEGSLSEASGSAMSTSTASSEANRLGIFY